MPDRVRVALPIPHQKQTPYIRYTTNTGVLLWVCTECRKALHYWLLCCECLKPLHEDCSFTSYDSAETGDARDYICKKCYYQLKELGDQVKEIGESMHRLTFTMDCFYLLTMSNLNWKCDYFLNSFITYAFTESVIISWINDMDQHLPNKHLLDMFTYAPSYTASFFFRKILLHALWYLFSDMTAWYLESKRTESSTEYNANVLTLASRQIQSPVVSVPAGATKGSTTKV